MLHFTCRGKTFKVNGDGDLTQERNDDFSGEWKFLGVSFHHWKRSLDVIYSKKTLPENLIGGLVWDLDHGTTRIWGGQHYGRMPRITAAWSS